MELDADTVLTAVYCVVDDLYRAEFAEDKPVRRGPKPRLSDSEVLTLAVLAQWQPDRSERAFVRHAVRHWRSSFPGLLTQSAFNRRVRDLWGVLCQLGPTISQKVADALGQSAYEVLDGVAVPLARRCRGRQHRLLADEARIRRAGGDPAGDVGHA